MRRFKGIIALDIDGTITIEHHSLDRRVNDFLNYLIFEGWRLIFITGRNFSFAKPILSKLQGGEYFLSVQNGAALYAMPSQQLICKHYISSSLLSTLPSAMIGCLLVESGKDQGDICYYCPAAFTQKELDYIQFRIQLSSGKWVALNSFQELEVSEFAAGKYFSTEERVHKFADQLHQLAPVHAIVIRDPFNPGHYLAFMNDRHASKGTILGEFRQMHAPDLPAIGAGDDYNDVEMLKNSTFKIVMQNGPRPLHSLADLIAKPAQEHGIIDALKEAIRVVLGA